jgi:hypothetical protein
MDMLEYQPLILLETHMYKILDLTDFLIDGWDVLFVLTYISLNKSSTAKEGFLQSANNYLSG